MQVACSICFYLSLENICSRIYLLCWHIYIYIILCLTIFRGVTINHQSADLILDVENFTNMLGLNSSIRTRFHKRNKTGFGSRSCFFSLIKKSCKCSHYIQYILDGKIQNKPIGSMWLVYLPSWKPHKSSQLPLLSCIFLVCRSHGWSDSWTSHMHQEI